MVRVFLPTHSFGFSAALWSHIHVVQYEVVIPGGSGHVRAWKLDLRHCSKLRCVDYRTCNWWPRKCGDFDGELRGGFTCCSFGPEASLDCHHWIDVGPLLLSVNNLQLTNIGLVSAQQQGPCSVVFSRTLSVGVGVSTSTCPLEVQRLQQWSFSFIRLRNMHLWTSLFSTALWSSI